MIIVIEGVDCTGKSTLANEIAELTRADGDDVAIIHMGQPKQDPMIEYEFSLHGYKPASGKTIICDRWHLGADVYGPLKRFDAGLPSAVRWHIEAYLRSRGALLFLAAPENTQQHLDLMSRRGEDYIDEDEAVLCADAFDVAYRKSLMTKMRDSMPFDAQSIIKRARIEEQVTASLADYNSYVGPPRPKILLVGDRKKRDEKTTEVQMLAEGAFAPYSSSSGKYLLNALIVTAPKPTDMAEIGMVNGNEDTRLDRLWDTLRNPRVVALGAEAQRACKQSCLPHTSVFHPAYVRRFMHKHASGYGKELWQ